MVSMTEDASLPAPSRSPRSSGDEAAAYIKRLIFEGHLGSGTRIPQDEIAARLGRSRVPVREALIALQREGWVEIPVNRGAYVARITTAFIRDHYELLGMIYGLAARRAVERGGQELTDELSRVGAQMRDLDDLDRFHRATIDFHDAVVGAADSGRIRGVLRSMAAVVPGNFFAEVPGSAKIEQQSANRIRRAIADGDGELAAEEYLRMIRRHGEMVLDLLVERGVIADA